MWLQSVKQVQHPYNCALTEGSQGLPKDGIKRWEPCDGSKLEATLVSRPGLGWCIELNWVSVDICITWLCCPLSFFLFVFFSLLTNIRYLDSRIAIVPVQIYIIMLLWSATWQTFQFLCAEAAILVGCESTKVPRALKPPDHSITKAKFKDYIYYRKYSLTPDSAGPRVHFISMHLMPMDTT